jgi:hypothetical protein
MKLQHTSRDSVSSFPCSFNSSEVARSTSSWIRVRYARKEILSLINSIAESHFDRAPWSKQGHSVLRFVGTDRRPPGKPRNKPRTRRLALTTETPSTTQFMRTRRIPILSPSTAPAQTWCMMETVYPTSIDVLIEKGDTWLRNQDEFRVASM